MVVVVNGRQIFNRKIRDSDAFISKHSSYCSVTHPFPRVLKSCTTSTSQMPAVYFIPLYSLICLSIASTRSTRYVQTAKRQNIPPVLGIDCIFVLRVFAVYEGTNGQNAAITGTTTLCCVFKVFRTESTRRVFRTASTCEYSHYEPIRLFAVLPGMTLLPPKILAALAVESTTGEPLSTVRNITVLPE